MTGTVRLLSVEHKCDHVPLVLALSAAVLVLEIQSVFALWLPTYGFRLKGLSK